MIELFIIAIVCFLFGVALMIIGFTHPACGFEVIVVAMGFVVCFASVINILALFGIHIPDIFGIESSLVGDKL